jgi:Asp-tRNA(Asn)/Glu-tRNA(Gln) amidotransferase A subunit family amidase|uniref:amidase n=1 Tax=Orrella sp. TaxID=1921583 RepID=UPI00404839EB
MSSALPNTISGFQNALERGEIGLKESTNHQFERFATLGQRLRSVTDYFEQETTGESFGPQPLTGVALAHKDIFDLKGRLPGLGRGRGHTKPGVQTACAITPLQQSGALNLGALPMAEDACAATGQTANLPTPLNPLGKHLAVGGSSSGSAVAVAAGMVYASLGTDTAGSVRMPAMTCGVMGLKTTHGLISTQGVAPLSPSLDSVGILARSVQDLSCILGVLVKDIQSKSVSQPLRTAFWLEGVSLSDEVSGLIETVFKRYGQYSIDLSKHEQRASTLQQLVMAYETGQTHQWRIAQRLACQQVTALGMIGLATPHSWFIQAIRTRQQCTQAFIDGAFAQADVLLLPLQVAPVPQIDEVYTDMSTFEPAKLLALHRYCGWINYLGLPALSIPVGLDSRGLPISIQLVARPFHEHHLLSVAEQLQHDLIGEDGIKPVCQI